MVRRSLAASIAVWARPQREAEGDSWTDGAARESIDCSEVTDPILAYVRVAVAEPNRELSFSRTEG